MGISLGLPITLQKRPPSDNTRSNEKSNDDEERAEIAADCATSGRPKPELEKNMPKINEKITRMGAPFKFTPDNPEEVFLKAGYELNDEICIIEKSVVFQMPNIPATVLDGIRSSLPTGYSIYAFEKK